MSNIRIDKSSLISALSKELTVEPSYIIFTDGTTVYARNGRTGQIEFQDPDASTVMAQVVNALPPEGGVIYDKIANEFIDLRKTHLARGENVSASVETPVTLLDLTGAGVVELFWIAVSGNPNHLDGIITFTIDGESVQVDLGTLFLYHWTGLLSTPITKFHAAHVGGLCNHSTTTRYGSGWISYPIFFKSSMKITFTAVTNPATIWWQIRYRTMPVSLRRTKIACVRYVQEQSLAPGETLTMVDRSAKGRLLAIHLVEKGTNFTFLENDPIITVDGEEMRATGTEDFFLSGFYYGGGIQVGPYVGCTVKNTYAVVQFRDFLGERGGIPFFSSLKVQLPNDESTVTITYSYVVIWEEF